MSLTLGAGPSSGCTVALNRFRSSIVFLCAIAATFLTKSSGPEQGESSSSPPQSHTSPTFFLYRVSSFGLGGVDATFGLYSSNHSWVFAFHQFACQLIGSCGMKRAKGTRQLFHLQVLEEFAAVVSKFSSMQRKDLVRLCAMFSFWRNIVLWNINNI